MRDLFSRSLPSFLAFVASATVFRVTARFFSCAFGLVVLLGLSGIGRAQDPQLPVNVITGNPDLFAGDTSLQKQVEPAITVVGLNSKVVTAYIDYRTSLLGPTTGPIISDAWLGLSVSVNNGITFRKNFLMPGHPFEPVGSPGRTSPLYGKCNMAGDPVLDSDAGGLIYLGGVCVNSANGATYLFVTTLKDMDDGTPNIQWLRTVVLATGNTSQGPGQNYDKPSLQVDNLGSVHFAATVFSGNSSKALYAKSTNQAQTFPKLVKLSETVNLLNGTSTCVNETTGDVHVQWTGFGKENGIWHVRIPNRGDGTPTKPEDLALLTGGAFNPFHQPTLPTDASPGYVAFRTNAFSSCAVDAAGTLFVVIQERSGSAPYNPRIKILSLPKGGAWRLRKDLDPTGLAGSHQIQVMPTISSGGGQLHVAWYDSKNDTHGPLDFVSEFNGYFFSGADRTIDVYVTRAELVRTDNNTSNPVYKYKSPDGSLSDEPVFGTPVKVTKMPVKPDGTPLMIGGVYPVAFYPNVKNAKGGKGPFLGDYISILSKERRRKVSEATAAGCRAPLQESFNPTYRMATEPCDLAARGANLVYATTQNVVPPLPFPDQPPSSSNVPNRNGDWTTYDPPDPPPPFGPIGAQGCKNPQSRDTNVNYVNIADRQMSASTSGTSQQVLTPNGPVNEFVFRVRNHGGQKRFYRATIIDNAPPYAAQSKENWSAKQTQDVNSLDFTVLAKSTFAKTIYYLRPPLSTLSLPVSTLRVTITEIDTIGGLPKAGGANTEVLFTPAPTTLSTSTSTLHNLETGNLETGNLETGNFQTGNLETGNSSPTNLETGNLETGNLETGNLETGNFVIPDGQATLPVTNTGVTSTAAGAFVNLFNGQQLMDLGQNFQLLIYQVQNSPGVVGCTSTLVRDAQILSNIPVFDQSVVNAHINNTGIKNLETGNLETGNQPYSDGQAASATYVTDPGDQTFITLRAYCPAGTIPSSSGCSVSSPLRDALAVSTPCPVGTSFDPATNQCQVSLASLNQAGNPGPGGVPLPPAGSFFDLTGPEITFTVDPPVPASGFFGNETVKVLWTVKDAGSGISSSTQSISTAATTISPCPGTLDAATALTKDSSADGIITVGCSATNGAGLTGSNSVTIKFDKTPPVITPTVTGTLGNNGWYTSNVNVTWSVTDLESGIASSTGCGTTTLNSDTTGITLTCSATNGAGLTGSNSVTIKRDATNPTITLTTPPDGSTYILNRPVAANFSCSDATSGVASCVGTVANGSNIDTGAVGTKTFTVNATDNAGNTFSKSATYKVVYQFAGFFSPLAQACDLSLPCPTGSNSGVVKKGQAIPVKFRFTDYNGVVVSADPAAVFLFTLVAVPNSAGGPPPALTGFNFCGATGCTGGSTERFDPGGQQDIVNADTSALPVGFYNIVLKMPNDLKVWWTLINVQP